jgi:hypothetical protein
MLPFSAPVMFLRLVAFGPHGLMLGHKLTIFPCCLTDEFCLSECVTHTLFKDCYLKIRTAFASFVVLCCPGFSLESGVNRGVKRYCIFSALHLFLDMIISFLILQKKCECILFNIK